MRKIPTVFERDWDGDRSKVVNIVNGKCQWVLDGEGEATVKIDGTCCRILNGALWKRRELKPNDKQPERFELADFDDETGKTVGWVPVGDGPEDKWHREAFSPLMADGTYELMGPKIQGNPDKHETHVLVRHGTHIIKGAPRTFDGLRDFLAGKNMEGLVFHHPDGRMAKIKLRDFGLKRPT